MGTGAALILCAMGLAPLAEPSGTLVVADAAPGVLPVDAERAAQALRGAITALGVGPVRSADETTQIVVDAAGLGITCGVGEAPCAARLGVLAGVSSVVILQLGIDKEGLVARARALSPADERLLGSGARPTGATDEELTATMRDLALELFAPYRLKSSIRVTADIAGGRVFVDGVLRGTTPLSAPIGGLDAGEHTLRLEVDGREPTEHVVAVPRGALVDAVLAPGRPLALAPAEPPPRVTNAPPGFIATPPVPVVAAPEPAPMSPWLWAGGATAAAGVALAVGGGIGAALAESALAQPMPFEQRTSTRTGGAVALALVGLGAAAAAGGAGLIVVGIDP